MQWIAKIKNLLASKPLNQSVRIELERPLVITQAEPHLPTPTAVPDDVEPAYIIDPLSTDNDSFGSRAQSPNGRWVLSWKWLESINSKDQQTFRKSHFQLVDSRNNTIIAKGELDRPNAGKVANNGYFCFEDWHDGNDKVDTFRVFDYNGVQLVEIKVRSTVTKSAISYNGLFAVFQTLNSFTEDGNKLFLIDLITKKLVYAVAPDAGWADRYDIDEATGEVIAQFKELGSFRYGPKGNFLDAGALARAKLASAKYEICIPAAEKILLSAELNPAMAQSTLSAINRLMEESPDGIDLWLAKCLKLKGLAYQSIGDLQAAMDTYDQVLAIEPSSEIVRKRDRVLALMGRPGHES